MDKFQDISIKHMDNGLKVKVGCMKLVYQQKDLKQFLKDIEAYFKDPEKTEKLIRKRWKLDANDPTPESLSNATSFGSGHQFV